MRSSFFEKHWECDVFRDFLDGKHSIDEIYFYLNCREILLDGPGIEYPGGQFGMVMTVQWNSIMPKLKLILQKFEKTEVQVIFEKLLKASQIKGNNRTLDHAFVLRVLLEMYIMDKRIKYKLLKASVLLKEKLNNKENDSTKSKVSSGRFKNFEEIREFLYANFPSLCETDIIEIYSKCVMISKIILNLENNDQNIEFDTLYTVLQEYGYLIDLIRIDSMANLPNDENEADKKLGTVLTKMNEREQNQSDRFNEFVDRLGLESLGTELKETQKIFDCKM